MTYAQLLEFVFSSGRIKADPEKNYDDYLAEVKAEIAFEAQERADAGDLNGSVEDAVKFALDHVA